MNKVYILTFMCFSLGNSIKCFQKTFTNFWPGSVKHKAGRLHCNADAFSRNPVSHLQDPEDDVSYISAISGGRATPKLLVAGNDGYRQLLKDAQRADAHFGPICAYLADHVVPANKPLAS